MSLDGNRLDARQEIELFFPPPEQFGLKEEPIDKKKRSAREKRGNHLNRVLYIYLRADKGKFSNRSEMYAHPASSV
jgi:hypothetical protein